MGADAPVSPALPRRLGDDPDPGHASSRGPRQAPLDGFDLHANVWVPPNDRARRERLCRYLLRPPLAQDRLQLRGRILVQLKSRWRDGPSHLLFEPIELWETLAAITPRPPINLVLSHGVLAPNAPWRAQVVRYARPAVDAPAPDPAAGPRAARTPRAWTWAALMRRVWDLDVLACPRGGGRLRVIATVQDPAGVHPILAHLARANAPDPPGPAPIP